MTFKELIQAVESEIRMPGAGDNILYQIKKAINDAVTDFVRLNEWKHCKALDTITLTGASSYVLSSLLSKEFFGELALLTDTVRYKKKGLDYYQLLSAKTGYYSISGGQLYIEGDAGTELSFLYLSPGTPHPLVDDADENLVSQYYSDVIQNFAAIKVLEWLGEKTEVESQRFAQQLNALRAQESRIDKKGKFAMIHRHNED